MYCTGSSGSQWASCFVPISNIYFCVIEKSEFYGDYGDEDTILKIFM